MASVGGHSPGQLPDQVVFICTRDGNGRRIPSCGEAGGPEVRSALLKELAACARDKVDTERARRALGVQVVSTRCMEYCMGEDPQLPVVLVCPGPGQKGTTVLSMGVTPEDVPDLVDRLWGGAAVAKKEEIPRPVEADQMEAGG